MATTLSPSKVTGKHCAVYEAYYTYVDPNGHGIIGAIEAARFLKKSGLSDVVLSRVWDLSDPGGLGCLDKTGLFVALKLVALAQSGRDINMTNITIDMPPPKMGGMPINVPKKSPLPTSTVCVSSPPSSTVDWTIKSVEREKYNKTFDSLQPVNGVIPGNIVKGVLMESKLPIEALGQIWELADQDKDGSLNRGEFIAAMHLVYKALEKHGIPNILPPQLISNVYKDSNPMTSNNSEGVIRYKVSPISTLSQIEPFALAQPILISGTISTSCNGSFITNHTMTSHVALPSDMEDNATTIVTSSGYAATAVTLDWVVTADERVKSDVLFVKSDIDRDGFVSGMEIKDVFLQSGVPQSILAHIWALCDIGQVGKLNSEQFALAMWLVAKCLKGQDPPAILSPDMVPPSFRMSAINKRRSMENNNSSYSNPELEMISRDIEELSRERLSLDMDISQKEAGIRVKTGEIKNLQIELDTLAATLKQLDNQKGEAQKRLSDLKSQVEKLSIQASEQADVISTEEAELFHKKQQLESLKQEEQRLEKLKQNKSEKLFGLGSKLQETQLNISQAKALVSQLEEQRKQIHHALTCCDNAIESGDVSNIPDAILTLNPDYTDSQFAQLGVLRGETKENGFRGMEANSDNRNSTTAEFYNEQFSNDHVNSIPFDYGSTAQFKSAFSNKNAQFAQDPFDRLNSNSNLNPDPFGGFGGINNTSVTPEPDKDAFGCDPFAVLHAPIKDGALNRASSPSPALPPKKAKPPRPAPPRPQPPASNISGAANMSLHFANTSFADFANFDEKFSSTTRAETSSPIFVNESASKLEFTVDPFKDYRYVDPFNIAFEEEAKFEVDDNTSLNADASFPILSNDVDSMLHTSTAPTGRLSVPLQNPLK